MKIAFFTLGCKVNQYETQVLEGLFLDRNFEIVKCSNFSNIYLVNSCTVTAHSDYKIWQLALKFKKINSEAILVLVGCFPQAFVNDSANNFKIFSMFDIVVGNSNKFEAPVLVEEFLKNHKKIVAISGHSKLKQFSCHTISNFKHRFRAFIKIEDGCSKFCSYCIIPRARGYVKSKSLEQLKFEVEKLADNGYLEIVLVGINLSSYGVDFENGTGLIDAVSLVSKIENVKRIRLGSLEPDLLTESDIAILSKNKKFCPNFHLALQSGSDDVLKRMRRNYTTQHYLKLVNLIFESFDNPSITTDLMVGFPQETELEFEQSLNFVSKIGFLKVHIFPYSKRAHTLASLMSGQVSGVEKKLRVGRMKREVSLATEKFLKGQVGRVLEVLFEKKESEEIFVGHAKNYCVVRVKSLVDLCGRVENVKIEKSFETFCFGVIV